MSSRQTGIVKFFNSAKGYGFIIPNSPINQSKIEEVFVHHTAIHNDGGFKSLKEGEEVEYDLIEGPKGFQAANVSGPEGIPVQGDPFASLNQNRGQYKDEDKAQSYWVGYNNNYYLPVHGVYSYGPSYVPYGQQPMYIIRSTGTPIVSPPSSSSNSIVPSQLATASWPRYQTMPTPEKTPYHAVYAYYYPRPVASRSPPLTHSESTSSD
ncbi:cold-shock transcription factor [Phycomyces blakesleeanus]|uniref:Cold-shock transcription factor n=2 Tax=Phycomyces blakesleeanus TaxID=4837 RepID=A0A167Q7W4_PHYB8|nr:cold-shock transcription factor [Phycomyces blakesleeanus NRRL 1555(-)]OAD79238.1 cold-shock transcription factor [Phycomyces blakesleeanus NRRL 1555(-)]|eukprot:XP_018297278.1 cold-shock transcription factor [Phycomyces blakesleeanus NRRL 1555(-)]